MPPACERISPLAFGAAGLLIAGAILINQTSVHWQEDLTDPQMFGYCGWRVAEGAVPYLDVWDNKPPGIWYVNAAAYLICGEGIGSDLLASSVALTITLVTFAALVRRLFHPSIWLIGVALGCLMLTHLRYDCGGNRTETWVSALQVVTIYGLVRASESANRTFLMLSGFAAGAAVVFKQSGAAAGIACGVLLLLRIMWPTGGTASARPRRGRVLDALFWISSAAIGPAIVAGVLTYQGAVGEAWRAVVTFNRAYFDVGDATWIDMPRAFSAYGRPMTDLWLLAGLAAAAWIVHWRRPLGRVHLMYTVAIWFAVSLYLALVGPGRQGYHLAPTLPPLCLMVLYGLHLSVATDGGFASRVFRRPSLLIAAILAAALLSPLEGDNLSLAKGGWSQKPGWTSLSRTRPTAFEARAALVRRLSKPGERFYAWGLDPGTYRWAYRPGSSRFATMEKCGQVREAACFILDGAVSDIWKRPPAVLEIHANDITALKQERYSAFGQWIEDNYGLVDEIDTMGLYERK